MKGKVPSDDAEASALFMCFFYQERAEGSGIAADEARIDLRAAVSAVIEICN